MSPVKPATESPREHLVYRSCDGSWDDGSGEQHPQASWFCHLQLGPAASVPDKLLECGSMPSPAGWRVSLGLKLCTGEGQLLTWAVTVHDLPPPQQHLGAGNGSPAPAGVMGQSAVANKVMSFQSAQLPHLAPCRSTEATPDSPGLERFKVLWPLPSWLLWCHLKVSSVLPGQVLHGPGSLPLMTLWEARTHHFCLDPHLCLLSCSKALQLTLQS